MRANYGWWTLMVVLCQAALGSAADAVRWAPSLDAACQTAARSNRLVLVHFYTDSCPPCRAVDRNVFSVPSVADTIDKAYVPVKINAEHQPQIAAQLKVDRWPTDILMTPAGYPVHRTVSPQTPEAYIAELRTGVSQAIKIYKAEALALKNATPPVSAPSAPAPGAPAFAPVAYQQPPQPGAAPPAGQPGPPAANDPRFNPGLPNNYYGQQSMYANGQPPAATSPAAPPFSPPAAAPPATPPYFAPPAPAAAPAANSTMAWPGAAGQPIPAVGGNPTAPPTTPPPPSWGMNPNVAAAPPRDPRIAQSPPPATGGGPLVDPRVAAASASVPAAPEIGAPAGNPPIGIDGFCPVTLAKSEKWIRGNVKWGAIHRGRTYLFKSEADQKEFLQNPDLYSPMLSGFDPVKFHEQGVYVAGKRQLGIFYGKQMYFFSDEDALKRFWSSPEIFARTTRMAMSQSTGGDARR